MYSCAALEYAVDAIKMVLAEYIRRKRDIPVPSNSKRDMRIVPLPAITQAKLALCMAHKSGGVR